MAILLTDWFNGTERDPAVSEHFTTIDGTEIIEQTPELIEDLARRVMEAKTSRAYLEAFSGRLGWTFLSQRLAAGPSTVRRGDFGEVVAVGWLEDFTTLVVPVKKLRIQISPGQTLPGTDAVGFKVVDGVIERAHFLESKLRTTSAWLTEVGTKAYGQLVSDREEWFLEILQFVHERLFEKRHDLIEPLTVFLEGRDDREDDAHEIVLLVDSNVWDESILTNLDATAGELPGCTVHALRCQNLTSLIDDTFAAIGAHVIVDMDED